MVFSRSLIFYIVKCDNCGRIERVLGDNFMSYNSAQAVRSIGWSFGKDKRTYCPLCRKHRLQDKYK